MLLPERALKSLFQVVLTLMELPFFVPSGCFRVSFATKALRGDEPSGSLSVVKTKKEPHKAAPFVFAERQGLWRILKFSDCQSVIASD